VLLRGLEGNPLLSGVPLVVLSDDPGAAAWLGCRVVAPSPTYRSLAKLVLECLGRAGVP
jgi:hypothetical protein